MYSPFFALRIFLSSLPPLPLPFTFFSLFFFLFFSASCRFFFLRSKEKERRMLPPTEPLRSKESERRRIPAGFFSAAGAPFEYAVRREQGGAVRRGKHRETIVMGVRRKIVRFDVTHVDRAPHGLERLGDTH